MNLRPTKRRILRQRVEAMCLRLKMKPFLQSDMVPLVERLMDMTEVNGIDDVDLRSMVRLYNREVLGRQHTTYMLQQQQETGNV